MVKRVRYNGGHGSYYECSNPSILVEGDEYEVIEVHDLCWQTNYVLDGIEGEFNSIWFDTILCEANVYTAISHFIPLIGERYNCQKIVFIDRQPKLVDWYTSIVKEIQYLGNNIYQLTTCNSVYIVTVG